MIWKPNTTVAAIIEQDNHFLMVKEQKPHGIFYNQPAGHLEAGESLLQASIRETREETAYRFTPAALIGIYRWHARHIDTTFLRFTFYGSADDHHPTQVLDDGILEACWMSLQQIQACHSQHRSPLVMQSITDYLAGKCYPLEILKDYD